MARRIFGFHNFNSQVAGRELVGLLESAVARRAEAQKAAAREWPYWIRGKIGYLRVVFYGVGSRQYARDYVVPRDLQTRHQERVRGRLGRRRWGRGGDGCGTRYIWGWCRRGRGRGCWTEWYVGRLGAPGAGQRVFICAQRQRDGWRDRGKVFSEVVVGRVEGEGEGRLGG